PRRCRRTRRAVRRAPRGHADTCRRTGGTDSETYKMYKGDPPNIKGSKSGRRGCSAPSQRLCPVPEREVRGVLSAPAITPGAGGSSTPPPRASRTVSNSSVPMATAWRSLSWSGGTAHHGPHEPDDDGDAAAHDPPDPRGARRTRVPARRPRGRAQR